MPDGLDPLAGWQRFIQRHVSRPAATAFFSRFVARIDRSLLHLSRGHFSPSGLLAGWPIVRLTTTGAHSGQKRTTPLIGIPDGKNIILIASNYGKKKNPAWYYNLKANPRVILTIEGRARTFLAREANGKEYDRYWRMAVDAHIGYDDYRARAGRTIPVCILEPEVAQPDMNNSNSSLGE